MLDVDFRLDVVGWGRQEGKGQIVSSQDPAFIHKYHEVMEYISAYLVVHYHRNATSSHAS